MKDFCYYAPTEVVFGEQSEEQVGTLVQRYGGHKVLVHYGGQSAVKSGLLEKICRLLEESGIAYVCLGGVVPNPRLKKVHEGIEAMEAFYRSIGMPVNIHELIGREITDAEIDEMVRKCSRDNTLKLGRFKVLEAADMKNIYQMAK